MKKVLLTAAQFMVLCVVGPAPVPGRIVRKQLAVGLQKAMALPTFYELMTRMEAAGYIDGRYEPRPEGQGGQERHYWITDSGMAAWKATSEFYRTASAGAAARPELRFQN